MRRYLLPAFFLVSGVESALAVWGVIRLPSESGRGVLLGLSAGRLVIVGGLAVLTLAAMGIAGVFVLRPAWRAPLMAWGQQRRVAFGLLGASLIGLWEGGNLALYAPAAAEPVMRAVLLRLRPILFLGAVLSLELILLLWLGASSDARRRWRPSWWAAWAALAVLVAFVWLTERGWGYMETVQGSGEFRLVEAPLLGVQVALAAAVVAVLWWAWGHLARDWKRRLSRGWLLPLAIWLLAFALWSAMPLKASWFADPPRPPNYTWSPNSDAYLYEATAQSLLAGAGLRHPQWGAAVLRPLYSGLLALFHVLSGPGYEDIIPLQVAFLALAPVLLYAVTRRLASSAAGALAALLMILRERNALALADTITVSHPKLLMADLPAALGFLLAVWLTLRWLEQPRNRVYPVLLGGALGAFLLVRLESFVTWGLLLLVGVVLFRRRQMALWWRGAALAALAFVAFVSPWVWRNWRMTGQVYLVSPGYEQAIWEKLFGSPEEPQASGGSPLAMRVQAVRPGGLQGEELGGEGYRGRHFVNNLGNMLLYLPAAPQAVLSGFETLVTRRPADFSAEAYVRSLPYWWSEWDGRLSAVSLLPLWLNLTLLALGLWALWRRSGWAGMIPAGLALIYIAALTWIGRSGGRWLLEVDWVSMMLVSVGVVEAGRMALGGEWLPWKMAHTAAVGSSPREVWVALAVVFLLGLALPLAEQVIPRRYTQAEAERRLTALLGDASPLSAAEKAEVQRLLDDGASVWLGRALYPRFFAAGEGMEGLGGMHKRPYSRLEWFLVGSANLWVVFPGGERETRFPRTADVLIVGMQPADYFDVALTVRYGRARQLVDVLWAVGEER